MKKIVSALLVSAAISTPAFAVGFSDGVVGTKYAVVDVGSITYGGYGSATSISVGGGYQVARQVAIEANYLMGGKLNFVGGDYQLTALQVMAVGNYAFTNEFSAYGKAGLAFNSQKVSYAAVTFLGVTLQPASSTTVSSTDLAFAIGAKYKLTKDITVRAQYMETGISSVNQISVGAMFNF